MPQVDVITGEKRQRRWSLEEKQSILAAAFAPGAVAAHIARRVNVSTGQIYTWRKQLMKKKPAGTNGFSQVVTVADLPPTALPPLPAAAPMPVPAYDLPVIELQVRGYKVRIPATVPPALAAAVVRPWCGADDPGSRQRADLAGGRTHRHAQGHEWPGAAGPGGFAARSPCRRSVRLPRKGGDMLKIIWHDGLGMSLYVKRLEHGRFIWPAPYDGVVSISAAQLNYMLSGIDWRNPVYTFRPSARRIVLKQYFFFKYAFTFCKSTASRFVIHFAHGSHRLDTTADALEGLKGLLAATQAQLIEAQSRVATSRVNCLPKPAPAGPKTTP